MKKLLALPFLIISFSSWSQITDDSTKQIYSAKTVNIIYEQDLKNNKSKELHPDTTLYELEKWTQLDLMDRKYQDLGNNGTALYPIFYSLPTQIGRTSGLSAYDPYMVTPSTIKYYDTKSPYIDMHVVFGGSGRSLADVSFSRNVNKNWNLGFDVNRVTSDKQIGSSGSQDRNVVGTVFDVYTYYKSDKRPYSLMFNVSNMDYNIEETGGIYIEDMSTATSADLYEYLDSKIQLDEARVSDKRVNIHFYHQYNWTKQLQFYHAIDINQQKVMYSDFSSGGYTNTDGTTYDQYLDYYGKLLFDEDSTYELITWKETVNELGIKGDLANLFYRLYLKRRDLNYGALYLDPTGHVGEMYAGGYTRFDWKDKFNVEANAEIMQSGEYKLIGKLNSDYLFGSYTSMLYKPSFLSERYFGNTHEWDNSFVPSFVNEIKGGIQVDLGFIKIRPTGRLVTLNNYVYYGEAKTPEQTSDLAVLTSFGGDFNFRIYTNKALKEGFFFENEAYYSVTSGADANVLRVPNLFYNGRVFWRGAIFQHGMGVEIGLDVHAKSSYYAMGYAPEIQQYYLQDDIKINAFYTADFFFNMKVMNVRAFVKRVNVFQQANSGYFITPYYPGMRAVIDFGVRWLFFD